MPDKGNTKTVEKKAVKWKKYIDDESNTPYYYNKVTGESSWEVPEDYESIKESVEEKVDDNAKPKVQWTKHIDDETGDVYYYDEVSEKTQWEKPEDFIEAEESDSEAPVEEDSKATKEEKNEPEKKQKDSNWMKYIDATSKKPYFHNKATGKTQWDEPEDYVEPAKLSAENVEYMAWLNRNRAEQLAHSTKRVLDPHGHLERLDSVLSGIDDKAVEPVDSKDTTSSTSKGTTDDSPVWQQHVDPQTQRFYYYNTATGVTQWTKPDEPIASGLADWMPAESHDPSEEVSKQEVVSGIHYAMSAKFNRVTGKYEQVGGEDYFLQAGIAPDKAGRQMSNFFDLSALEKNREEAKRIKEQLKRKNIDWKKINAEKKAKRQKKKNQWLFED